VVEVEEGGGTDAGLKPDEEGSNDDPPSPDVSGVSLATVGDVEMVRFAGFLNAGFCTMATSA